MAGVYIHIPFCKQACHYCNFHFAVSVRQKNDFLKALLKEIELQKQYLRDSVVETIYLGGGTPSILESSEMELILNSIRKNLSIASDAEVTLEANPDDISKQKPEDWRKLGVNRLSIGVQSFYDEDLQWMNRAHNANQAEAAIQYAYEAGINNLTIDLIYGSPGLDNERWKKNLEKAGQLNIAHLSCYALTIEEKTPLDKMIKTGKKQDVNFELQAEQFDILTQWSREQGYEHYEISNFAKPGYRSRHNSSYWKGIPYLGLGPSAHSFNGKSRQWNIANNNKYIESINQGTIPFEVEELDFVTRVNEFLMISLRTSDGVSRDKFQLLFGKELLVQLDRNVLRFVNNKRIALINDCYILTAEGKFFADGIAADLFFDKDTISNGKG